ncbi:MAG: SMU1112c/YaeR family gloxylase I-like metalloprotein [Daejeonella sp.]
MLGITSIHHVAIICSDYAASKAFYTDILGFKTVREVYRAERHSFKLDLEINGHYQIELFSFPDPPDRPSRPEARGLRHLAFEVNDLEASVSHLNKNSVLTEEIRIDEYTGKRFVFFSDPDGLPLELYEV